MDQTQKPTKRGTRINCLSDAAVKAKTKWGSYADGGGLYLQVAKGGSKSWIFRYMLAGRAHRMGLGSINTVSLKEARLRAAELRQQLQRGGQRMKLEDDELRQHLHDAVDPLEQRKAALVAKVEEKRADRAAKLAAKARATTFKQAAEQYIERNRESWKNKTHRAQWPSSLKAYAYPIIGDVDVADVDTAMVLKVLEPIWDKTHETATRVRCRIEKVLDAAKVRGLRSGENPARWKGHLQALLPKHGKGDHQRALPYAEVSAFVRHLREKDGNGARALEFTILTAARTGETIGATWQEIDLGSGMWTIPAARMKGGKEHRAPLSARAIELLKALPREDGNPHLFLGGRKGEGLSNMAMSNLLKGMHEAETKAGSRGWCDPKQLNADGKPRVATVHGFRSTFRDWAAEQTAYPNEMVEIALAHGIGNKTEAAYRRGDMVAKRQRLMSDWAAYCGTVKAPDAGNVEPIRRAI